MGIEPTFLTIELFSEVNGPYTPTYFYYNKYYNFCVIMFDMAKSDRIFQPLVIQDKQEFLQLLKNGKLKYSKYNVLNDQQKLFVELVVFGGYSGEQAMKAIDPEIRNPKLLANRMASDPDVSASLEELSMQKDKKFMTELSEARELALSKLMFIMSTTKDEALAAAAAKTIIDASGKAVAANAKKDEGQVGQVKFSIQVENAYMGAEPPIKSKPEPVVINIDDAQVEEAKIQTTAELQHVKESIKSEQDKLNNLKQSNSSLPINPDTGLPYTISYEGVNSYEDKEDN